MGRSNTKHLGSDTWNKKILARDREQRRDILASLQGRTGSGWADIHTPTAAVVTRGTESKKRYLLPIYINMWGKTRITAAGSKSQESLSWGTHCRGRPGSSEHGSEFTG